MHLNQTGKVSSPADLRYREDLLRPGRIVEEAGSVVVGQPLRKAVKKASTLKQLRDIFPNEKFLINPTEKCTYMLLEQNASGEDALKGWLVAALAADMAKSGHESGLPVLNAAYKKMEGVFPTFLSDLKKRGWHTDQFLDGNGKRFAF